MKKNVSWAVLLVLLFGFGFISTSHGNNSRQSTQSDRPVAKRLDDRKEEEEKTRRGLFRCGELYAS